MQQQPQQQPQVTQAQDQAQAQSCPTPQQSIQRSTTPIVPTDPEAQKPESGDHIVESPSKPTHTVSQYR